MEDIITEAPPPSRFFEEDLNNFTPPSPPLPSPFLLFTHSSPPPSLLIVTLSPSSNYLFQTFPSKTLIGTLVLPELPIAPINPSGKPFKGSVNIYSLNNNDASVFCVIIDFLVKEERGYAIAKVLLDMRPGKVLVLDSVQTRNFRGRLNPDETVGFKLMTSEMRLRGEGVGGDFKGLRWLETGSMVEGLGAAVLARCQVKKVEGMLCVTWPEFGVEVMELVRSVVKEVVPGVEFGSENGGFGKVKDLKFESDLYT